MSDEAKEPEDSGQEPTEADATPVTEDDYPIQVVANELEPAEASLEQFPAIHGQPDVEVAQRSQDVTKDATGTHRKVFVLVADEYGNGRGFDHEPNKRETVRYMVQNGLRPLGDVSFDGSKKLPDGRSVALAYTVKAVPAVVATGDAAHLVIE